MAVYPQEARDWYQRSIESYNSRTRATSSATAHRAPRCRRRKRHQQQEEEEEIYFFSLQKDNLFDVCNDPRSCPQYPIRRSVGNRSSLLWRTAAVAMCLAFLPLGWKPLEVHAWAFCSNGGDTATAKRTLWSSTMQQQHSSSTSLAFSPKASHDLHFSQTRTFLGSKRRRRRRCRGAALRRSVVTLFDTETTMDLASLAMTTNVVKLQQHHPVENNNINGTPTNGTHATNGVPDTLPTANGHQQPPPPPSMEEGEYARDEEEDDVPRATENGGFTHTQASRKKISAANKGKPAWNKGRKRLPEEKARIAAGVRAKNRQRFLQKLADLGVTEQEYEAQKKEQRRAKEAERRTRLTEKGGYRPTDETRQKISKALKGRYQRERAENDGVAPKRKAVDPSKVRRGFTHTPETKRKISEALRRRWADDENYRNHMKEVFSTTNVNLDTRKKISASLKNKWRDPDFRGEMLAKMSASRAASEASSGGRASGESRSATRSLTHREKISAAIKAKWQDEEYRKKTMASIARRRKEQTASKGPAPPRKKRLIKKVTGATPLQPKQTAAPQKKRVSATRVKGSSAGFKAARAMEPLTTAASPARKTTIKKKKKKKRVVSEEETSAAGNGAEEEPTKKRKKQPSHGGNGSVDRLREERRDLYELLYGDEDEHPRDHRVGHRDNDNDSPLTSSARPKSSIYGGLEGDENLDSFDPYGLEDF